MFDELNVFLKIVESNSMAQAGRVLKISPATVARKLAHLEEHLGVRLIERNTRVLALTQAGHHCYERCKLIPLVVDEMMDTLVKAKGALKGTLNLSIATYSGYHELLPLLVQFNQTYPNIVLNVTKSNVFPDLIDDSYDVYVRYGEVQTRSFKSMKLIEHQLCLCASESYLNNAPPLDDLSDLDAHRFIVHLYNRHEGREWEFLVDGQKQYKKIDGHLIFNNSALVIEALQAGGGLAYLPTYFVRELPEVKTLLPVHWPAPKPVFLTYPRTKQLYEKIRVFVEFLREAYSSNLTL